VGSFWAGVQTGRRVINQHDMAQAGGTQPEHLGKALASVQAWVEQKL
jgi:alanyl-tRNA synthetase